MKKLLLFFVALILCSFITEAQVITSGSHILIKTRENYFFNSIGSTGNVSVQQVANQSAPTISDEIFTIEKINGRGNIYNWDRIYIKTRAGYYFNSPSGRGNVSAYNGHSDNPSISDEIFTIEKVSGSGVIRYGDYIYIKTREGYYFNSPSGRGNVSAYNGHSDNPGISDEIFTIIMPSIQPASLNVRPTQPILGNYRILNQHSNKFVGIIGSNITNGAQAIQWDNNNQSDIEWDFMPNTNGTYRIRNMNSGRYLTAQNDGKAVQLNDYNRDNVNWILVPLSDGSYKIKNNTTGKFLAVAGAALHSGAEIITWDDNNQPDIKWSLSLVTQNVTFDLRTFTTYPGCNYPNGAGVVINEGYNPSVFDRTSRVASVQSGNLKLALYEYGGFRGECLVLPFGANNPCIDVGHRFHLASSIIATRR